MHKKICAHMQFRIISPKLVLHFLTLMMCNFPSLSCFTDNLPQSDIRSGSLKKDLSPIFFAKRLCSLHPRQKINDFKTRHYQSSKHKMPHQETFQILLTQKKAEENGRKFKEKESPKRFFLRYHLPSVARL